MDVTFGYPLMIISIGNIRSSLLHQKLPAEAMMIARLRDAYCYTSAMKSLRLEASVLQSIRSHAEHCYPFEACGLLLGRSPDHVLEALAMDNQAEDRRDAYLIDPEEYLRTEFRAEDRGLRIVGVWHSHPDGKPEPSATDTRMAWPDWHYLIAAVQGGRMGDLRAWILHDGRFEEEVINP